MFTVTIQQETYPAGDGAFPGGMPTDHGGTGGNDFDFLQLALRYRWLLIVGVLVGGVVGEMVYRKLGPQYQGTAKILVSKKAATPIKEGESQTYGERGEHIALIMSPMIVRKAVENHQLENLPSLAGSDDPVQDILDGLIVKRSAGQDRSFLNVLDIFYRNPSSQDAKAVVEAVVEAYREYLRENEQEHSVELAKLISETHQNLLKELRIKEEEYLKFRESAPLHWRAISSNQQAAGVDANVHRENLDAIEAELRQNLLKRAEIKSKIRSLEEAVASGESQESLAVLVRQFMAASTQQAAPAGEGSAISAGNEWEDRLLTLMMEEQRLMRDFGLDHPDVQVVRKHIQTLINFYRERGVNLPPAVLHRDDYQQGDAEASPQVDFVAIYKYSLQQQLAELENREVELNELHGKETTLARELSLYLAKDQSHREEISRIKSLWETAVTRMNEINLVKDNRGYTLKEIAPPKAELDFKWRLKCTGAGLFVVMGLVAGLILLRELRDTTVKTIAEIRRRFRLPVFGGVPQFKRLSARELTQSESSGLHHSLCYLHRPGSLEAEAYRTIRTAVNAFLEGEGAKTLMISSAEPGDGKTTSISNLALAIAQAGKRVLLIDADLRRPMVHHLFGLTHDIGLTEVLAGEIELPNAIQQSVISGLSILAAGEPRSRPAELLSSERLQQVLAAAQLEYDVVLVDAPPLLAVSDPCVVAPHTDGLLLVLRLGKTRRPAVTQVNDLLHTHGIRLVGVIANESTQASGGQYGYSYGDRYLINVEEDAAAQELIDQAEQQQADSLKIPF